MSSNLSNQQNSKPLISIIVPIYKVEKFLKKCIDSILNQSFSDFEVILVDDESPDNCGKICDIYSKEDNRIKVIHKKNGGLSDARNAGIDMSKGDYILFIDSDDYVEKDIVEILYNLIYKYKSDFSACNIMNCYKNNQIPQCDIIEELFVDNKIAYKLLMEGKKISGSSCAKLYKKEIFEKVRFIKGRKYEDAFFFSDIMPLIKTVAISTAPKYYYYHREGSYATTFNENDFDMIDAYEKNLNTVKNFFPDLLSQGYFRLFWGYFMTLDKMLIINNYKNLSGYKKIVNTLKKNAFKIMLNKNFNLNRKIAAFLLFFNVRLYRVLVLKNNEKNLKLYDN